MNVRQLTDLLSLFPPDTEIYGFHRFDATGLEVYAPAKVAFPSAFDDDDTNRAEQGLPEGEGFIVIHAHTWGGGQ